MIDVIIPAHIPSEIYVGLLNRALKSLEQQTYQNFNVILILNGSYIDKDILLNNINFNKNLDIIEVKEKITAGRARNIGIKKSNSKYIAQLDADDQYHPEKLQKQINFMEKNNDIDILGTLYYVLKNNNLYQQKFSVSHTTDEDIKNIIDKVNVMACGSIMFKKQIFDKYNLFYEEDKIPGTFWENYGRIMHEDWDLWIRYCKAGAKIYNLPEYLYFYTLGTSVTG